jgi:peptidoglycan/xylan/chitin deacetylase (PgdA/CDA1 family)
MMLHSVKLALYGFAKTTGFFKVARLITKRRLRILAYHGFALKDEAEFRSKLFITPTTFERRLSILRDSGYRIITLEQAVEDLRRGHVAADTVVITIDDGYASTLHVAAPLLKKYNFPAIVYLTSYHMQTQTPVFDLTIAYMIWKTACDSAELRWSSQVTFPLDLSSTAARMKEAEKLIQLGHELGSEAERVDFARAVAMAIEVDFDEIVTGQAFRLMTPAEACQIQSFGVEVGLHTHRHRFPSDDLEACRKELIDNTEYLIREVGVVSKHFCYPSGIYSENQYPILSNGGISSATTCDTGLVQVGDSLYSLRRFLDGEMVTDIEFEAELSGFSELLRTLLRSDRRTSATVGR